MKNKAFTLVELLVVIAIIGILSSVVIASMNSARIKARDSKRVSDIKQIQLALEMYYDANNSYPTAVNTTNLGAYLSVIPTDPSTNAAYLYAALGTGTNCSSYHLGATLESGSNSILSSDVDASEGTKCTGSADDFNGTDPIYDMKPF